MKVATIALCGAIWILSLALMYKVGWNNAFAIIAQNYDTFCPLPHKVEQHPHYYDIGWRR